MVTQQSFLAIVTKPFQVAQTQYGKRGIVNFESNGNIIKFWTKENDTRVMTLQTGTTCRLVTKEKPNGKKSTEFIEVVTGISEQKEVVQTASSNKTPARRIKTELAESEVLQAADLINTLCRLHKYAYDKVEETYHDYALSSEDKRAITASIFIEVKSRLF